MDKATFACQQCRQPLRLGKDLVSAQQLEQLCGTFGTLFHPSQTTTAASSLESGSPTTTSPSISTPSATPTTHRRIVHAQRPPTARIEDLLSQQSISADRESRRNGTRRTTRTNDDDDDEYVMLSPLPSPPRSTLATSTSASTVSPPSLPSTTTSPPLSSMRRRAAVRGGSGRPSNSSMDPLPTENHSLPPSLPLQLHTAHRLFDLLSAHTDMDHPLCQDCAEMLVEVLEAQWKEAVQEKQMYEDSLDAMLRRQLEEPQSSDADDLGQCSLEELQEEERTLRQQLERVEQERASTRQEWDRLCAEEEKQLRSEEDRLWAEANQWECNQLRLLDEQQSRQREQEQLTLQLDRLKKANVFDDTFHIWHDGAFGTINGLRLGRLPEQPVEWSEINAAWGQAILLLDLLAKKLQFQFQGYALVPLASFSRIEKLGEAGTGSSSKVSLELYGSGDIHLSRLFWNRRFEQAMVAFLQCLQQLGAFCEAQDSEFRLPYRIEKEKIGDVSIKLQFNQDEQWTRALKYTLTNLKWLMAFTVKSVSLRAGNSHRFGSDAGSTRSSSATDAQGGSTT